ncbi:tetratricopeptide repeat-containing glycosyltransferase family protein [Candidatus Cyanaurora vandensis]|uniref:tetratricopeptide repeat-containing glycosyltransferase family protein n=1 Tax=Candidatus Cyanaurora vandensis TaxID=2714958 RepID=UPI0025801355|nr:tetratricopeptide repeat-containing glycosyltransferase family protein [Candidatus Cyanaurora vandensis]
MKKNKGFGKPAARSAPELPGLLKLAHQHLRAERFAEAGVLYHQVLQLDPDQPEALHRMGVVLQKLGRPDTGIAMMTKATQLKTNYSECHYDLGHALLAQCQVDAAQAQYERVLVIEPELAQAHFCLGNVLMAQSQPDRAEICYQQACALLPTWAEAHNGLGNAQFALAKFTEAGVSYQQACQLQPDGADVYLNLGMVCGEKGQLTEALAHYQKSLELNPNDAQTRFNRACLYLSLGNFAQGWAEYECRWGTLYLARTARTYAQPLWTGESFVGRTVFLYPEQGLGDNLQFIRYASLVKARGGTVVVECPASLKALFATCVGIDHLVATGETLPPFDLQLPLMSLPHVFQTDLATIPHQVPYLFAPADCNLPLAVQTALMTAVGLRVGIVWAPGLDHPSKYQRYCPLHHFTALLTTAGVSFFSLYQGPQVTELAPFAGQLVDVGSHCRDFNDTAWAIAQVDLVVTVDTSVTHLAGALGKPTWVLLPAVAEWRWLLDRADSPWYPTARLFRQPEAGDWAGLLTLVQTALLRYSRPH